MAWPVAVLFASLAGPVHARRRHGGGGSHGDGSGLDAYLPFMAYGLLALLVLCVIWLLWRLYRRITRASGQSRARIDRARQRSQVRAGSRR